MEGVGEHENARNYRRLETKIEELCSEVQFRALPSLPAGFWVFANFVPGCGFLKCVKILFDTDSFVERTYFLQETKNLGQH